MAADYNHKCVKTSGDEFHIMEVENTAEAATNPTTNIYWLFSIAFMLPSALLYTIVCICLTSDYKSLGERFPPQNKSQSSQFKEKGVYIKMQEFIPTRYKIWRLHLVITSWLGCLFLLWLVVNLCVPGLRKAEFFGYLLWKWSLLATLLASGHPCMCLTMGYIFYILMSDVIPEAHNAYYFTRGLIYSVASLLYFGWILLVWLLIFQSDQGLNPISLGIYKYITWTLVSLLVGAILWVLKCVVLFQWRAKAIYLRFNERILMAGFHLFFLTVIVDGMPTNNSLLPWKRGEDGGGKDINEGIMKKRSILDYISTKHVSLQQIKIITQYVMDLAQVTQRDDDDRISDIIQSYQEKIGANNKEYVTEEAIRDWMKDDEAKLLISELRAEFPSMKINEVPFLKWMVDAHKSCVSLGHTIIDAFAMISVLDTILTSCLVVVVILFWLLVTDLATTKVLVVIASPFLALTFVFGDTCKAFFQGFVFSFVVHPFDIGDRCIIDGVEVEIKRIGILTTSCFKIGTKEKMLYPNSTLATKLIINLESKPDPTDVIELVLDSSTEKFQLLDLQKCIEKFLEDQCDFYEKPCRVLVKVVGNSINMSIHFKHIRNVQDVNHSKFLEKKESQRSMIFMEIKQFLQELDVKLAAP